MHTRGQNDDSWSASEGESAGPRCGSCDRELGAYVGSRSMPVSAADGAAADGAAAAAVDGGSNDDAMLGWLNMMRVCDGAFDVRLRKFREATTTTTTTTTESSSTTAMETATVKNGDADEARKCEEQLSLLSAANSCSSCKSASHTAEMAQEDQGPSWDNLPSVILQEIFSYLSHDTRIRASQVCRNWRDTLFHPSFWKKIVFVFKDKDSTLWARFLTDRFALSVQEATIRWDTPKYIDCMNETYRILKKLSPNKQLKKLFLEFYGSAYSPKRCNYYRYTSMIRSLVNIIETSNCLEALSLGCMVELIENQFIFLEPLRLHHAKHLTHLSLASVKDTLEYNDLKIDTSFFNSFVRLSVLTLDYEFVSDTLLKALDNGCMQRLVIHVHSWKESYPGATNRAWQLFVQKNPQCELRLNLIHSYVGVKVLDTDIFCPAMPLTDLKVLFCENVNIRALLRLSEWYSDTLRSVTWVDSINRKQYMPSTFDPNEPNSPDPLVLVAWKCTKLTSMVFLGHKYYQENLLAIARLRGSTLKLLVFAKSNISSEYASWNNPVITANIIHEIRDIMGLHWTPLSDTQLPTVILDPTKGHSREVIMSLVLCDQK
ncbi:F-box only protein 33 isoform X2 [Linepithema humile]